MPTVRYAKSQIAIPWLSDVLVVFPLVFGSGVLPEELKQFTAHNIHGLASRAAMALTAIPILAALYRQILVKDCLFFRKGLGKDKAGQPS